MKRENKRKALYQEKTEIVPFRCPISKKEDFKEKAYEILDGYKKEAETKNIQNE